MKIFVTGATGFVGAEVVRQLLNSQFNVRILSRNRRKNTAAARRPGAGVQIHTGDVMRSDSLRGALDGVDAVVHLVGIISEVGARTFENVHVLGTRNILAAAQEAGVRRLVHMSALGTRPNAASRYHQTKWAAEEAVRHSGLEYTIFRPSLIFGPDDHFVNLFARLSSFSPVLPVIGSGETQFAPIAVQDVARAFVASLNHPAAIGETLDLCGPETLTLNQILDQILSVLGRRRLKWHIPLPAAYWQAGLLEWIFAGVLRRPPPLNRDQVTMLQEDNIGSGQRRPELLGGPQVRFRDGIAAYLKRT